MYEKLYLVSAAQLEKINQAKEPAINYSQLYNAVIRSQATEESVAQQAPDKKLSLQEWLTLQYEKST